MLDRGNRIAELVRVLCALPSSVRYLTRQGDEYIDKNMPSMAPGFPGYWKC